MITVTLYTREGCHLCEQTKIDLVSLSEKYPHKLIEIDIEQDDTLQRMYFDKVPVVEVGPYRKTAPLTQQDLMITLGAAIDRENQLTKLDDGKYLARKERASKITKADKITYWLSKHYMLVFNLLVFLYVGLPFIAPVLMNSGLEGPARLIYKGYGFVCHQLSYRSWFLFGEQAVYPRSLADVEGYLTFQEATGITEGNTTGELLAARNFFGNEQAGYKVAFCQRDVSIYAGILLFGLIFAISGHRIPGVPWYLWLLIGLIPIGLDGFSQMLSQPPFSLWPYRESTPILRTLTGGLFGFFTAWFGYPMVEETMRDNRMALKVKFEKVIVINHNS